MPPRQSNYTNAEDILLCQTYMEISQDPAVGIYQSSNRFWSRVEAKYNESREYGWEERTQRSMQARIQMIEKATRKYHGCIRAIESLHQSGASNEDIMKNVNKLYKEDPNYKSGWKFDHVWDIVKNFEKFKDGARSSRQPSRGYPTSESDNPTSDSQASPGLSSFTMNLDDEDENILGDSSSSRPIGRKKAKLKKKLTDDTTSMIVAMQKQNEQLMEDMKTSNAQMEQHLAIRNKNCALKEMKEENKILYMDLSSIEDPHVRAYTEAEKTRILHKRAQQQGQTNPFAAGAYPSYFNNIGGSGSGLPDY